MTAYHLSVWFHILGVAIWLGGLLFVSFVVLPILRHRQIAPLRSTILLTLGLRMRILGWITLFVLFVTGITNLLTRGYTLQDVFSAIFWSSQFGSILQWKLILFFITIGATALHDLYYGPKSAQLAALLPENHPDRIRIRRLSSWLGRFIALLGLALSFLGILLSRGY